MQELDFSKDPGQETNTNNKNTALKARGRSRWAVGGLAILGLAIILAAGCDRRANSELFIPVSPVFPAPSGKLVPIAEPVAPTILAQDPTFMQCQDINYMPEANLFRDPLSMPNGPKNPQIQHAIDTLQRNGVYDLLSIDLLPQGTKLKVDTITQYYCLPDLVSGRSRFFIQTGEGVGAGIPYGLVNITLPEGLNPIVLTRAGQRYPGSDREKQQFLFLNFQAGQEAILENADGSYRSIMRGPLAIQTAGPTWRSIDFILPERGFADDMPIPGK